MPASGVRRGGAGDGNRRFDTLAARAVPVVHPMCALAMRFCFTPEDAGRHKLSINIINEERDEAHIVTIEDPIEYYHKHKKAIVTQREIGVDVPNFAEALEWTAEV